MLKFLLAMMSVALLLILVSSLVMLFDVKEKTYAFFNFILVLGVCLAITSMALGIFFLI